MNWLIIQNFFGEYKTKLYCYIFNEPKKGREVSLVLFRQQMGLTWFTVLLLISRPYTRLESIIPQSYDTVTPRNEIQGKTQ